MAVDDHLAVAAETLGPRREILRVGVGDGVLAEFDRERAYLLRRQRECLCRQDRLGTFDRLRFHLGHLVLLSPAMRRDAALSLVVRYSLTGFP